MKTRKKTSLGNVFSATKALIGKFPVVIWGSFALLGAAFFGLMLGYMAATDPDVNPAPYAILTDQNRKLSDLVNGYERISELYHLQGENVGVILDQDIVLTNPEEIKDAFNSIDQYRGMINVQYGRIMELRRAAGLPEDSRELSN